MHNSLFLCKNNKGDYMEKTGMTRRIDELGRLVIPKEIRKNLKIKNNDQLEIEVIDNKIVLIKYDNSFYDNVIKIMINLIKKIINKNVLYTTRDKIIDYSLINKDKYLELNSDILNIIENRKDVFNYKMEDSFYSISPIIIYGDLYGSLIIYGDDEVDIKELEIIKFSKLFLENYLE